MKKKRVTNLRKTKRNVKNLKVNKRLGQTTNNGKICKNKSVIY